MFWLASLRIGFPGWRVLAGVGNTFPAAASVAVFDLWGQVGAGVGVIGWCSRRGAVNPATGGKRAINPGL
jgi:hypothetical protein